MDGFKNEMKTARMIRLNWWLGAFKILLLTTLAFGTEHEMGIDSPAFAYTQGQLIERGGYLLSNGACNNCHLLESPNSRMDSSVTVSDLTWLRWSWELPSKDRLGTDETNVKGWTGKEFVNAIRDGRFRKLHPDQAIWLSDSCLTQSDIKAIFEYLKLTKNPTDTRVTSLAPGEIF